MWTEDGTYKINRIQEMWTEDGTYKIMWKKTEQYK